MRLRVEFRSGAAEGRKKQEAKEGEGDEVRGDGFFGTLGEAEGAGSDACICDELFHSSLSASSALSSSPRHHRARGDRK